MQFVTIYPFIILKLSSPSSASPLIMSQNTRQMSFYEMSLLKTQFELDDAKECVEELCKNKLMIDTELNDKIKLVHEMEAKSKRFKRILLFQ